MMADSKIVFGVCLLSVAFVAVGSAQEITAGDDGTGNGKINYNFMAADM